MSLLRIFANPYSSNRSPANLVIWDNLGLHALAAVDNSSDEQTKKNPRELRIELKIMELN